MHRIDATLAYECHAVMITTQLTERQSDTLVLQHESLTNPLSGRAQRSHTTLTLASPYRAQVFVCLGYIGS